MLTSAYILNYDYLTSSQAEISVRGPSTYCINKYRIRISLHNFIALQEDRNQEPSFRLLSMVGLAAPFFMTFPV